MERHYGSEAKVAECACSAARVKEKVGGFDVAMDDASGMDVTECTKHATEIGFNARH
jgi:hypothetical protein